MNRTIREARPTDITEVMQVMEAAKKIMRQSGNMHQWVDGYPSEAVVFKDISTFHLVTKDSPTKKFWQNRNFYKEL